MKYAKYNMYIKIVATFYNLLFLGNYINQLVKFLNQLSLSGKDENKSINILTKIVIIYNA